MNGLLASPDISSAERGKRTILALEKARDHQERICVLAGEARKPFEGFFAELLRRHFTIIAQTPTDEFCEWNYTKYGSMRTTDIYGTGRLDSCDAAQMSINKKALHIEDILCMYLRSVYESDGERLVAIRRIASLNHGREQSDLIEQRLVLAVSRSTQRITLQEIGRYCYEMLAWRYIGETLASKFDDYPSRKAEVKQLVNECTDLFRELLSLNVPIIKLVAGAYRAKHGNSPATYDEIISSCALSCNKAAQLFNIYLINKFGTVSKFGTLLHHVINSDLRRSVASLRHIHIPERHSQMTAKFRQWQAEHPNAFKTMSVADALREAEVPLKEEQYFEIVQAEEWSQTQSLEQMTAGNDDSSEAKAAARTRTEFSDHGNAAEQMAASSDIDNRRTILREVVSQMGPMDRTLCALMLDTQAVDGFETSWAEHIMEFGGNIIQQAAERIAKGAAPTVASQILVVFN